MKVSQMAENLISSEIIKIAADVNEMKRKGKEICNLTIGDFNPEHYPIPDEFKSEIINSYNANNTNYPQPNGMLELRESVSEYMKRKGNLDYSTDDILISAGSRPLIFATYMTIVDSGDKIVFPLPSWNNNHYSHITGGSQVAIETKPENNFMPT
ncbi:MAG: aminotransferase class I/II-fold pyridoxal phosphate-dependent enzyme, partial [Bacteroidia bacterium]|nr:aminotransferase class I/II-fold pyridoxal phosphate-dependent enzyme [Bacteroidia bacterium]